MAEPEDAIPAATVIVMREVSGGAPELLMVERAAAMKFAGGALVFPGGRIDPGDNLLAAQVAPEMPDAAARIAAIRETVEEAGVAIGLGIAPEAIPELRRALHGGEPMRGELRLHELVPFARWLPRNVSHRVFDTYFYLARAPEDCDPVVDGSENVRLAWMSAQGVLDAADRGEAHIIFPTRRNLERLAQLGSWEEAVAHAAAYSIRTVTPWIEERDGERHLCIPDDIGYPVTSQRLSEAMRG